MTVLTQMPVCEMRIWTVFVVKAIKEIPQTLFSIHHLWYRLVRTC